jgi:acetyl-CoA carboxylase biotin carboxyl carrier protein
MKTVRRQSSPTKKGVVMNLKDIKELVEMLKDTDISELEVERAGVKVRIRKGGDVSYQPVMPRMEYSHAPMAAPARVDAAAPAAAAVAEPAKSNQVKVTSPIVGTFYRAPSPDKAPYVQVGDTVKKGQVLCIVEAMKLMNEIESEASGKVVQILLENGKPVEYGQTLFIIEPA